MTGNQLESPHSLSKVIEMTLTTIVRLFLLYINDLPKGLSHCDPRMYADDTHLSYASDNVENIESYLNQDLENIYSWLRANRLTLNMTKTEFMLIGSV